MPAVSQPEELSFHSVHTAKPSNFKRALPQALLVLLFGMLVFASRNPQTLDHWVQHAALANKDAKIQQLCELDQQAQSDNTYSSELRYLNSWIGAIAEGDVHTTSVTGQANSLTVTIPQNITQQKAKGRATFYRIMFVGMRKQYLPQGQATDCSVAIYNTDGKQLAVCNNGMHS